MPSLARHLHLVLLLMLLAAALPAARPAYAQTFTVASTADTDDGGATCSGANCTLRKAIRLANENSGPDTITFGIAGTAPFTINVATALPPLSGGGTTINVSPAHSVVLSGAGISGSAFGLRITSANNVVRGLVVVGFPGSTASVGGAGISISTPAATGNVIANNWLGLNADGTTTFGNTFSGVQIDEGASNNLVGGAAAGEGNVITGNLRWNIAVDDSDTSSSSFISGNQIVGNYIGLNPAGTAVPASVNQNDLAAGVFVSAYARDTLIRGNRIGGHLGNSTNFAAGIVIESPEAAVSSTRHPQGTTILGNYIGVTPGTAGNLNIANRNGIRLNRGALNTTIGDPDNPVAGRNVIGFSQEDGIQLSDNSFNLSGTTIAGNYIGLADNGTTLAPIGTAGASNLHNVGIYLGTVTSASPATIGPANVIASVRRHGIRVRSGGNSIKGNFIGTNAAGTTTSVTSATTVATVGYSFGDAGIWVENGAGNQIGGPNGGDRNVIAAGSGATTGAAAPIVLMPGGGTVGGCGSATCSVTGTLIQGNYLGVSSTGDAALASPVSSSSEGLRITDNSSDGASTTASGNNTVRGNVISGVGTGIRISLGASNNTIDGNRIGTRASGVLDSTQAIRNRQHGIALTQGTGNQITNNIIAFNGDDAIASLNFYGINIDNTTGGANNNTISGNTLVRNGDGTTNSGILINGPTGILISRTTTRNHNGEGIQLANGGNNNLARPTLSGVSGTVAAATLAGSTGCGAGCTVEVFTSATNEPREGPVYLTSGTTTAGGNFSINVTGCQRYLTATVRDASNNTSPFSDSLDSTTNPSLPCVESSFSLSTGSPASPQLVFPGESITYSHSITNNAPIARTFSVVIDSSLGWASGPTQVTVPANSSASFNIVVSVPHTATPTTDVDTTRVQVFVGAQGSTVQTDVTTARAPSNNPAAPAVSPGQTKARTGGTTTFTHTVTNTGDQSGIFSVVGPNLAGTPPTGWSIASATLADPNLSGGESTTLTIVVNTPDGTPSNPLPAGSVQFSFRVRVDNGAQTNPATVDTITIPVARSFTFVATNPTGSPPTLSRPPGAAAPFVYTLTNTGNATDTFQVPAPANAAPLSFSVSPSGSFSLAAGASRLITVTAQVASGATQGDYNFQTTAQAVGGSGAPPAINLPGRVIVTGGGSPQLSFGPGTPNPASASGDTVTFTGTLTNAGNATTPFTLGAPAVTGSPAGWSAAVVPGGTCPASISLAAGASCTFTLEVTVPAGANGGPQAVTVSATADNSGQSPPTSNVSVTATATVNVAFVRGVSLSAASPAATQTGAPGEVLTYTHTLTNQGNAADSFTLSLAPTAPATASMAVLNPTSLANVPRNATRTVTLVVTVPGGVAANTDLDFTITAASQGDPTKTAAQTDTATVEAFDAASLSPGTNKNGLPGTTLTYTHTLTNTGSTAIAYDITATNSNVGFDPPVITSPNPTPVLNPGETATITIEVPLPTNLPGGTANTTTVQVRKAGSGPVLASATNESRVGNTYDVEIAPDRSGTGFPNESLVFIHTVTNIGATADTYTISATNALAWPMSASPNVLTLAPGASQVISVTIDVPNDDSTLAGSPNFGRVRVVSNTAPETSNDQATENITVGKVVDLVFTADQARAVTPSSGTIRMRDLVLSNTGNGSDIVDLTVLGADGGWEVNVAPFVILGPRDTDYNVGVTVKVPTNVQPGPTKVITIQARSRFDPTDVAEVRLRFVYIAPEVRVTYKVNLPIVRR